MEMVLLLLLNVTLEGHAPVGRALHSMILGADNAPTLAHARGIAGHRLGTGPTIGTLERLGTGLAVHRLNAGLSTARARGPLDIATTQEIVLHIVVRSHGLATTHAQLPGDGRTSR